MKGDEHPYLRSSRVWHPLSFTLVNRQLNSHLELTICVHHCVVLMVLILLYVHWGTEGTSPLEFEVGDANENCKYPQQFIKHAISSKTIHFSGEGAWPSLGPPEFQSGLCLCVLCCLQCFDTVGWAAGRASVL